MELNLESKAFLIGNCKINFCYTLQGRHTHLIRKVLVQLFKKNLKFIAHGPDVRNAYFVIRNIYNGFKLRNTAFYLMLYTTYIRPILEYPF